MDVGQPERPASSAAAGPDASSSRSDLIASALLLVLFAAFVARSWLAWGHVSDDYGREMYVPVRLTQGAVLYRDIRYPYGPLSPYLHALGYALFGPRLAVLYASGLAFTAAVVALLYATARQIASPLAAGLGAALAMVELMFIPALPGFSFIFPYAFPALHGLAFTLAALLGGLRLLRGGGRRCALLTGVAIGLALATKQEFALTATGIGLVAGLGMILLDGLRASRRRVLGLVAPALLLPAVAYGALATRMPPLDILRRGLFAPSYFGWPLTWTIAGLRPNVGVAANVAYLARLYLDSSRLYLVAATLVLAAGATVALRAGSPRAKDWSARWRTLLTALSAVVAVIAIVVVARALLAELRGERALQLRYAGLPLLLAVWACAESVLAIRGRVRDGAFHRDTLARWLFVVVAFVLLARVPGKAVPGNYANFYLAPGVVLAAIFLVELLPRAFAGRRDGLSAARGAAACSVAALLVVAGAARWQEWPGRTVALATSRGTLRLAADDLWLPMYVDALDYLARDTAPRDTVLAIPTETALYFLGERGNRFYETALIANLTTVDEELAYVAELERDPPKVVLISTRPQFEYGRGYFGRDFNQTVFAWIEQHYRKERTLGHGFLTIDVWVPRRAAD